MIYMTKNNKGWKNEPGRHALSSYGIRTTAKGKVSDTIGMEISDDDVEKMVKDLLPEEGKWYNHGDVDFEEYGGWAIKRNNGTISVVEVRNLPDTADESVIEGILNKREDIQKEAREELDLEDAPMDELVDEIINQDFNIYYVEREQFWTEDLLDEMNEETGVWSFGDVGRTGDLKWMIRDFVTSFTSYYGSNRPQIMTDISHITEDFE